MFSLDAVVRATLAVGDCAGDGRVFSVVSTPNAFAGIAWQQHFFDVDVVGHPLAVALDPSTLGVFWVDW